MTQQNPPPNPKTNGAPDSRPETPPASPASTPARAASLSSELPKPKKRSLWARVLDKETRSGRAVRAFIRTLGFIVGFYALGFFTAYTLFFQPLQRSSQATNAEVTQLRSDLEQTQADLDKAALTFLGVEKQNEQLSADLEKARARASVLNALVQVREARLDVALNDVAAARLALDQAEASLESGMPQLTEASIASADTFTQLFELARDDLGRNTNLAVQDLERLTSELQLASERLD